MNIYQYLRRLSGRFILTTLIVAFGFGSLYAQHLFSVSYGDLSQIDANLIITEVTGFNASVSTMSKTKNSDDKEVYSFSLSSGQNTKIVILNEETGNSVVITPADGAPAQFELPPFFIEELRQAALGDANRYLVVETGADFSVRKAASVSAASREVFIPRYFYGPKENVKEAFPENRQIIHIFKEKPILIPAFPDDPESLRRIAQLEEEMSYYVYMYQLPDGTLTIYDEHFNPSAEKNGVSATKASTNTSTSANLQFNLSGTLDATQRTATEYALGLWSEQLAGTVPIDINVSVVNLGGGNVLGQSWRMQSFLDSSTNTWYPSTLWNQLVGYDATILRDIRIEMNSNFSFYWGLDGNASGGRDYVTIMLHEVTHGLGFFPLCGSNGAYAYTTSTGGSSSTNYPGIYDCQLYQGTTGNTCLTDLTQSQRATLVTSGNLYAGRPGSNLLAANGGVRVKMYAPNPWQNGSSVSHWDNNPGFRNFMQYSYQYPLHTFNARKIGIMLDMGWKSPISCVTTFTNQTVTSNQTIVGCDNLEVQNVTITSSASVLMTAGESIVFLPGFYVEEGANFTAEIVPNGGMGQSAPSAAISQANMPMENIEITPFDNAAEQSLTQQVKIYPNPATTAVTVDFTGYEGQKTISILDIAGKLISSINTSDNQQIIDVSNLAQGVYIVNVSNADRQSIHRDKLIKK